jgi:hypothetical protein
MSSPKQTAPVTDESEITTIPAGEAAAQATPSETARHDETPANTTTDPTMPATTTHQQTAPPDPTIHELPTESSPRPTQDAITTTHLQLPPPTTDLSSLNSPPPQETGLGPAIDAPITPSSSTSNSPLLSITLMLTTGARHPYKLDEKYLRSRKVTTTFDPSTGEFDPRLLSGYQLKELIWIDWRSEWEPRPANPSFIRLIVMGRLIEDKGVLKGTFFSRIAFPGS